MAINPKLLKVLDKTYAPDERYDQKLLGKDITYITNEHGEPITLFIGSRREDGSIAGERYVRRIVRKPDTLEIQKSHWENKGKVSRS
ncbi:hypothetical protein DXT99_12320 [Pontibacter diazotrophicus]|uniref:Uncharacterized protein n=1 Tax=Pontibacter diazotrophicus TaxID=1400979 RepID=A0A3D8LBH4_9BACT|nr:hypothetical protein [Pontibacter diazotrophicus]RDV14750.1 hypothetical protein DXT99_12320 [Pontibacter diazotrophicus]